MSRGWLFFLFTLGGYVLVALWDMDLAFAAGLKALRLLAKILPVLIGVVGIMALTNAFVSPNLIKKYLSRTAGWKKWLFAVVAGILSMGPIYMWYPFLRDVRAQGASNGFVAAFLYNRAVKPFLIPVLIVYFGLGFTCVLTVSMMVVSVFLGLIFDVFDSR